MRWTAPLGSGTKRGRKEVAGYWHTVTALKPPAVINLEDVDCWTQDLPWETREKCARTVGRLGPSRADSHLGRSCQRRALDRSIEKPEMLGLLIILSSLGLDHGLAPRLPADSWGMGEPRGCG